MNLTENNLEENNLQETTNLEIQNKQNNFLETTLGKTINTGVDVGLRMVLPDLIENQVIEVKDTLFKEGLGEGIKKAISEAVEFGKSAIGIVTGNFESVSQVQAAVQKGGIIDGVSDAIDYVLDKTQKSGILSSTITKAIKSGKNSLLNSVSNNIENEFNQQLESAEKLQKYSNNWKEYFNQQDFDGMTKEIYKIHTELKNLLPMENTIKEARTIDNLHNLIKNNGKDFNLTAEQQELAKMLT
jgi:hypothetical protein